MVTLETQINFNGTSAVQHCFLISKLPSLAIYIFLKMESDRWRRVLGRFT